MDYIIIARKENKELLGTQNATLVKNCKSMVKVNNALKAFNPSKDTHDLKEYRLMGYATRVIQRKQLN